MICNNSYFADILRVCEIKDLIWVMRFQSHLVYYMKVHFIQRNFYSYIGVLHDVHR